MKKRRLQVYQYDTITIFKCEDLGYEKYKGQYFVLEKSDLYGFFYNTLTKAYTKGEILDKYNLTF